MPTVNGTISLRLAITKIVPPLAISEPFYTGSVAATPGGAYNLPISIGGHRYNLEWAKYQRTTLSPFREARDQSALPGENSLNPLAAWKRSRDDWSLGAGQTWSDRTLDQFATVARHLEPRLFRASKGMDPWTLGGLHLLKDTELAYTDGAANLIKLVSIGDNLYVVRSDAVVVTTSAEGTIPWTPTAITGLSGTIQDAASDGTRLYISTSVGMFILVIGTTAATAMAGAAATYKPTLLTWTNGWLFGTLNNVISEIRADGTVNTVFTHLNSGFVFTAATGTPNFTYFGGQSTDVNELWRVGVKNDGTLSAAIFSGNLPLGEFIRSMSYYSSFVLIGSTKGLHLAAQAGDGSLNLAPITSTTSAVRCMAAESKFVWFGWSAYDTSSTGLGRVDMSSFSDEQNLVSAFASDLMYTDTHEVVSVVRHQGSTYFAIANAGVIREHATHYVAEGSIQMGRFRWGTFEPKIWLGLEVATEPLEDTTDGIVAMSVLNDSGVTTGLGTRGPSNGTTGVGAIYGVGTINKSYDWYEPTITLKRGGTNGTSSPIVRRVTLRALPVPKTVEQFTLPILMSEKVNDETGEGGEVAYNTSDEYRYLQGLLSQGSPVNFQIAGEQHFVMVREVGWDSVYGLTSNRDGVEGLLVVTLITAEI